MTRLPSGTVSFLYTDIEGSTALWQEHPDIMSSVIGRHDTLLRAAVEAHGGIVFRTVGDAVHAAFVTASDAFAAAIDGQRAIGAEPWPEGIELRVRMAIHSGAVEIQDDEYAGHTLNRIARIVAAGHGGQILVTGATAELVRHSLPSAVSLRDLGEHRLKDLALPEHLYGVCAPGLPTEFPPLRSLDLRPTNLPVQRGPLLGRERELREARELLTRDDVGLVTFTGTGGTGKTSLAIAVGHDLLDRFADGVWFVSLAPITDPELVAPAIASALGFREQPGRTPLDLIQDHLRGRQMLLILDNFEQVTDAAPLIARLLAEAPRLTVLATSRIALRLREERELGIDPLALPDATSDLQSLSQYAAVQLFIARAQAVKADFAVTNENAPAVAEICARLDGLPLAVELAAARIRVLTPDAMLKRLQRRLPLLTGGAKDLPARQQTMESAIAWSYDLLSPDEQILYSRLSVFAGGFTLEAAEAVCVLDNERLDVLEVASSLVDKSLVRQQDMAGEPRFTMLQTIREYGLERLEERGEADLFRHRHASYLSDLGEELLWETGAAGPGTVHARFDAELDNYRAALDWGETTHADTEVLLRLAGTLASYWGWGQHGAEGLARTERVLARPDAGQYPEARATALLAAGSLNSMRGDSVRAMAQLLEGEQVVRAAGNQLGVGYAASWLAMTAMNQGDVATSLRWVKEYLRLSREENMPWSEATALGLMADITSLDGDLEHVRSMIEESLEHYRRINDPWGAARSQRFLAGIARIEGDYETAERLCKEALVVLRQVGENWNLGRTLFGLGVILLDVGKAEEAEDALTEGLAIWRDMGHRGGMVLCLAGLIVAAAMRGRMERARRLYAAEPFHHSTEHVGLDIFSVLEFSDVMKHVHEQVGDAPPDDFPVIPLDQVVSYALHESAAPATA